jgi:hypothetical protein
VDNLRKKAEDVYYHGQKEVTIQLTAQALLEARNEGIAEAEYKALMTLAGLLLSNGGKLGIRHDVATDLDNNVVVRRWTDEECLCEWFEAIRCERLPDDQR